MSDERKVPEQGWGFATRFSTARDRAHYFARDQRSLCGKWMRLDMEDLEDENDNHPQNCAACMKKVAKHRAVNA